MPVTINGNGSISGASGLSKVVQVVNATYAVETAKAGSLSYTDTGLTATITPTSESNSILVIVQQGGVHKTGADIVVQLNLLRNGSIISGFERSAAGNGATTNNYVATSGVTILDSPATTSPVTYKTQYASNVASGTISVQKIGSVSSITLMEIAA